jgi:glycosyltransferase involved in cell wall biosynthesis
VFAADLIKTLSLMGVDQNVAILRSTFPGVEFPASTEVLTQVERGRAGASLRSGARLAWSVKSNRPDIVQVHGGEPLKFAAILPRDIPLVYRRIGHAPRHLRGGLARLAYAYLLHRPSLIVAVSQTVADETQRLLRVSRSRMVVIPNGVDARRVRPELGRNELRRRLRISPDAFVLLSLGALTWEKDPIAHVRIAENVLARVPGAWHVIVGDGPLRAAVEKRVNESPYASRILVLGRRSDVGDVIAASDVVLFVSRPDGMEGMPAAVIEAGIAASPVVGYAVAGVPEVVIHGETGLLAPVGDESSVADYVARLSSDERERLTFGVKARDHCAKEFGIESVAERYLKEYERLLFARAST